MSTTNTMLQPPRIDSLPAQHTPEMFLGYTICGDPATFSREHEGIPTPAGGPGLRHAVPMTEVETAQLFADVRPSPRLEACIVLLPDEDS